MLKVNAEKFQNIILTNRRKVPHTINLIRMYGRNIQDRTEIKYLVGHLEQKTFAPHINQIKAKGYAAMSYIIPLYKTYNTTKPEIEITTLQHTC